MTEPEIVFLLTTFSNMARARDIEDCDFINAVVREIYEVYVQMGNNVLRVRLQVCLCYGYKCITCEADMFTVKGYIRRIVCRATCLERPHELDLGKLVEFGLLG